MLKRTITSAFIVITIVAFLLLRLVDFRLFDILIYGIAILSTFELLRAFANGVNKIQKGLVLTFTATVFPLAVFFEKYVGVFFVVYAVIYTAVTIFIDETQSIESLTKGVFALFYPTLPLLSLVFMNAMGEKSLYLILTVLTTSTFTDVGAYLIGSWLHGPKLCEKLSPNKTISGALGGLLGGVLATNLTYFIMRAFGIDVFYGAKLISVILFLVTSGVLLSATTQVGDLTESFIKRRLGVKDMGNLLPGHGGMLDRIDGLTFTSLITFVLYSFL